MSAAELDPNALGRLDLGYSFGEPTALFNHVITSSGIQPDSSGRRRYAQLEEVAFCGTDNDVIVRLYDDPLEPRQSVMQ